jgi:hypothetical protein
MRRCECCPVLEHIVEQDHRRIQQRIPMLGWKNFENAAGGPQRNRVSPMNPERTVAIWKGLGDPKKRSQAVVRCAGGLSGGKAAKTPFIVGSSLFVVSGSARYYYLSLATGATLLSPPRCNQVLCRSSSANHFPRGSTHIVQWIGAQQHHIGDAPVNDQFGSWPRGSDEIGSPLIVDVATIGLLPRHSAARACRRLRSSRHRSIRHRRDRCRASDP